MKCICEKESLIKAVGIVGRLATSRATLPILQNIYLEVTDEGLILKSTDLEQTITATIPSDVKERGRVTVPARMLSEYLQNNGDHSLTLSTNDLTFHIHSANHEASFKGLAAEEYPTVPEVVVEKTISLPVPELSDGISKTIFASATDDTRPVLNGLLWRFSAEGLELVGTDGYRLAYMKIDNPGSLSGDYIIPKRSLQELVRLMEGSTVDISFAGTQIKFTVGGVELISRILEGKFPDYAAIIPKKKEIEVSVAAGALLQSLKLASLFSRDSAYSTKLILEENTLKVQATSVQLGDSKNEITLDKPVEKKFTISANAQYLIEALGHMSGEVMVSFVDGDSPIVLRPKTNNSYLYLVMPLRSE